MLTPQTMFYGLSATAFCCKHRFIWDDLDFRLKSIISTNAL